MAGKKPLVHSVLPPLGNESPLTSTTKPGRSWLSDPSPYVIQEPSDALPDRGDPVSRYISAGAWFIWSVTIDLTKATSSTMPAMCGSSSDTHAPLCPCCANLNGVPSR